MLNEKIIWIAILIVLVNLAGCSSPNIVNNDKTDYKQLYEKSLQDQPPLIKDIKFDGKIIKSGDWAEVGEKVKIVITLEGDCREVDLFYTPVGSAVYKEQKLIEIVYVEPGQNTAEYFWDVPQDTNGFFKIIAYNKDVGRRSDEYNVISKK
ncbi:hypothetical protein [Desulfitobacterium sp.]|uniref:hypothetical protein n=1 Tax=Desulfitobacterium sp. TaxID=49981 RepID=UPI002D16E53A|nr:hypothetical protein [Desulfitobacterium sp.]HVJ50665.1 hypothetical protein [Desulfitobacterium sp.]